jgi:hypothetical protein
MAPKIEIDPHALRTARHYVYDAICEGLQSVRPGLSDEEQRKAIEIAFDQIERATAVFEAYSQANRVMIGLLMNHFRAIFYDFEEDEVIQSSR